MNKNLIALAVAAAVVAPSIVAAETTVYGRAQAELVSFDHEDGKSDDDKAIDFTAVDNSMGRVGVKSSEDLGNGWTALAKFEWKADVVDNVAAVNQNNIATTGLPDDPATAGVDESKAANPKTELVLTARESMVGLKNKMVQIEVGRTKQAYKYTGGVKYDPFVATILEARGNAGMLKNVKGYDGGFGHSSFLPATAAVRVKSGPVKFDLNYGPTTDDGRMAFSVAFAQDNFEVFVAGFDSGDSAGDDTLSATKFGGQFKTGAHKISLQMESIDNEVDGAETQTIDYMFLGYQMKMGNNIFVAQMGTRDVEQKGKADASDDYMAIGAIHKFTKTARIFGGYRSTAQEDEKGENVFSVGLRKDF